MDSKNLSCEQVFSGSSVNDLITELNVNSTAKVCIDPSLNTQSCIRRPLGSTLKFENLLSPKKADFDTQKIQK